MNCSHCGAKLEGSFYCRQCRKMSDVSNVDINSGELGEFSNDSTNGSKNAIPEPESRVSSWGATIDRDSVPPPSALDRDSDYSFGLPPEANQDGHLDSIERLGKLAVKDRKNLLKRVSGWMAIFAALDLLSQIRDFLTGTMLVGVLESMLGERLIHLFIALSALGFAATGFRLYSGIMGMTGYQNAAGTKKCIMLGLILLPFGIFGLLMSLDGSVDGALIGILSLVFPALYLFAACKNMKDVQ
ncbi:MAG: hypothetical protein FWG83_02250 [Oscillospiraceae bacterium]|nr:hypothetical protein [Oscillospiraceae bacterium]